MPYKGTYQTPRLRSRHRPGVSFDDFFRPLYATSPISKSHGGWLSDVHPHLTAVWSAVLFDAENCTQYIHRTMYICMEAPCYELTTRITYLSTIQRAGPRCPRLWDRFKLAGTRRSASRFHRPLVSLHPATAILPLGPSPPLGSMFCRRCLISSSFPILRT